MHAGIMKVVALYMTFNGIGALNTLDIYVCSTRGYSYMHASAGLLSDMALKFGGKTFDVYYTIIIYVIWPLTAIVLVLHSLTISSTFLYNLSIPYHLYSEESVAKL